MSGDRANSTTTLLQPVQLGAILDDLEAAILRHMAMPEAAAIGVTLWVAHTWAYRQFDHSPRLAVTGPTMRCGKSTLLAILELTCASPLKADSITPAATFRIISEYRDSPITLLLDESDSYLPGNEQLRGILNSGYQRTGAILRSVENKGQWVPGQFRTYCPVAIAGIGKLPATLRDRSLPIGLKRKSRTEHVEKLRVNGNRKRLTDIAQLLTHWFAHNTAKLGKDPAIPDVLNDRQSDLAVPLLSIADAAGAEWGKRAREAVVLLFRDRVAAEEEDDHDLLLLADIRAVFDVEKTHEMPSAKLCECLAAIEARPWVECSRGRPITQCQLADRLRPFEIGPKAKNIRFGNQILKGYRREWFEDAWSRYVPEPEAEVFERAQIARVG